MPAPYKSLVLCFDGTWNDLELNTNVSRIYSEIADASTGCTRQQKFYDEGVGTHWYDRVRGGAFGMGLDHNIRLGYAWLATTYESGPSVDALVVVGEANEVDCIADVAAAPAASGSPRKPNGDLPGCPPHSSGAEFLIGSDLYILGFSRGAFTARSLGGLIGYLGIPVIEPLAVESGTGRGALADHPVIVEAWDLYKGKPDADDEAAVRAGTAPPDLAAKITPHLRRVDAFRATHARFPVRIHFWDTVGALGIPKIAWFPRSTEYQFHDTSLGQCIRNAFHAMAIDEHRQEYKATLWSRRAPTTERVQQRWFPGAHADVGGGYPDALLPARPLSWLAQCVAACGLEFVDDRAVADAGGATRRSITATPAAFDLIGTEYMSPVHDSYRDFMHGAYRLIQALPTRPGRVYRRMLVAADGVGQEIDETAFQKWKSDPEYRPPNLGQAGRQDVTFAVARDDDSVLVVARGTALADAARTS